MKIVNSKKMSLLLFIVMLLILSVSSVFADYDLRNNVVSSMINGVSDTATVKIGQAYSVQLSFKEREGALFPRSGPMTYTLPAGMKGIRNSGVFDIVLTDPLNQVQYTINDNTFTVSDTTLTVNFNENDPDFIEQFNNFTNIEFHLGFQGVFDGTQREIKFSDNISQNIEIDTKTGLAVSKQSSFDKKSGKVTYTLYINSTGINTDVVVSDVMDGTALIFNSDVLVSGNSTTPVIQYSQSPSGFTATFPSTTDGESITITYSAKLDPSKLNPSTDKGTLTYDETNNTVEIKSDEDPGGGSQDHSLQYTNYLTVQKGGVLSADGNSITWTITINEDQFMPVAGWKITDTIAENVQDYLKFSGGLTIYVYDVNGDRIDTRTADISGPDEYTWEYTIPETDTGKNYKYVITYVTDVDDSEILKQTPAKNTVDTPIGKKDASVNIGPEPDESLDISKKAVSVSTESITWEISFDLPANKDFTSVVLTDDYPAKYPYQDTFMDLTSTELVKITGLISNESYTLNTTDNNKKFTLTFYKDQNHSQEGLSQRPEKRTITVTFKTAVDQDWLAAAEAALAADPSDTWYKSHINNTSLNVNGTVVTASAEAAPLHIKVTKENQSKLNKDSVQSSGIADIYGVKLPFYRFAITLEGVTEEQITVKDEFDTDIFKLYTDYPYQISDQNYSYNLSIIGLDQWNQVLTWDDWAIHKLSGQEYQETATGVTFTPTLPKQPNGSLCDGYMLIYYLIVKDADALSELERRAASEADDFSYVINNKATYDEVSNDVKIKYDYKALEKTLLNADSIGEKERTAKYKITVNPAGAELNHGENITLTDTFSQNLNILYNTIKIEPADAMITYNVSGYTATYVIKDSTPVTITYNAMILGTDTETTLSNKSQISGTKWESDVLHTKNMSSSGGGTGTLLEIMLLKHEKGKMDVRLSGAEFTLYNGKTDQPMTYGEGGRIATFKTDANGLLTITEENGLDLYEDHPYYLIETKVPKGYNKDSGNPSGKWYFTLTTDPNKVDTWNYIYPDGYTMRVTNEPQKASLVLTKTISGAFTADTLPEEQKKNITFTVKGENSSYDLTIPYSKFTNGSYTIENITPGTYTVTETVPTIDNYTVSSTYSVTVSGDSSKTDSATVVITPDDEIKSVSHKVYIINNYMDKDKTEATAKKAWQNADGSATPPSGANVTFTLYADGDPTSYTVELNGNADDVPTDIAGYESAPWVASFVNLPKYKTTGTTTSEIKYTIKETSSFNGYTPSTTDPVASGSTITNVYQKDAEIELKVRKSFTGTWKQGQTFTFKLSSPDGAPMPESTEITVTAGERIKSFGTITFTADDMKDESGSPVNERIFTYRITEVVPEEADENGVYDGIRYDRSVQTVRITARIDEYGNIVVLGPDDGIYTVTFTNSNEEKITPTPMRFYKLPKTGFSALRPTVLSEQPRSLNYKPLAWTLEIPSLALITDIVEVPFAGGEYPVTWLGSSAGLLEGFGLPGKGSSVLTGHNHLSTMEAGPFALLQEMGIGDRIFVLDPVNEMQIFAVYANEKIAETDIRGLERIAGRFDNSLTLITCEDERAEGGYANRRIIAAKPVDR